MLFAFELPRSEVRHADFLSGSLWIQPEQSYDDFPSFASRHHSGLMLLVWEASSRSNLPALDIAGTTSVILGFHRFKTYGLPRSRAGIVGTAMVLFILLKMSSAHSKRVAGL
jgi:hypothetical protein